MGAQPAVPLQGRDAGCLTELGGGPRLHISRRLRKWAAMEAIMRRLRTSGHGLATIAGRRGLFIVWIVLLATSLRTPRVRGAENNEVIVERNVAAKMRDGVTLRADIYRPKADGKFPVLLVRTPYDKTHESSFGLKGAARGDVVIAQDVRGRFTSD